MLGFHMSEGPISSALHRPLVLTHHSSHNRCCFLTTVLLLSPLLKFHPKIRAHHDNELEWHMPYSMHGPWPQLHLFFTGFWAHLQPPDSRQEGMHSLCTVMPWACLELMQHACKSHTSVCRRPCMQTVLALNGSLF